MPDDTKAAAQTLSVQLVMDEAMVAALRADRDVAAMLDSYVIDCPEMAAIANTDMRASIERIAEIKKWKTKFVEPAKQIIANAEALFDPSIAARTAFVTGMRVKLTAFTQEQERIAEEAKRKREAEEREARQKAEAAAAAERAKAEQKAADERRQAEEAEKRRQEAEAAGNAKAAAKAAAEAAKLSERAAATLENGEARAAQAEMAVVATVPTAPVPEPAKISGFGLRDNWQLELLAGFDEAGALAKIVAGISGVPVERFVRSDLLPLLKLDMSAGNKLAKALKKATNVPGMQAVNRQTSVSRAA